MAIHLDLSFEERLLEVLQKTKGKVKPEVVQQLERLVEPEALTIIAGVLAAWVIGHAFAYGEVVDFIIGVAGLIAIGTAIFTGLDEFWAFARDTYWGKTNADFERAASHLATAIGILGIQTILGIIFRQRPVTKARSPGEAAPFSGGKRYAPVTRTDPDLVAGKAFTSWYGDIVVSSKDTGVELAISIFHERVHQLLTPKLYLLRDFRIEMRVGTYTGSSLWRWFEEILAYTVGYGRVRDWWTMFESISFPTRSGYVYWLKRGASSDWAGWGGRGIVPEGAGLIAAGLMIGVDMELRFQPGARAPRKPDSVRDREPVPQAEPTFAPTPTILGTGR